MATSDVLVRLRMAGTVAFTSAADAAATSVSRIGTEAETSARKANALKGLSRGIGAGLGVVATMGTRAAGAVGAAGLAAAGMGLKFDAGMEQTRVAFTNLLGNAGAAQSMLDRLYKIAAHTPFEFPQLTQATQRLLGFGMTAKDVIPTMTAVGDAVAAAGGGGEQIDRVTTALGQMQAKGKVSSEELNQMAESGVPALKILQQQLGLTGTQLSKRLQKGAVSADQGIAALVAGMNKRYRGAAASQSKTFNGMLSTLHDNAAQLLGQVMQPVFRFAEHKLLPAIDHVTKRIQKWVQEGGVKTAITAVMQGFRGQDRGLLGGLPGVLAKVGGVAGKAFRAVSGYVREFMDALKPAAPFLHNVLIPFLTGFGQGVLGSIVGAFKLAIPIVRIAATILGWLGTKLAPLSGLFHTLGLVTGYLATGPLLKFLSAIRYVRIIAGPLRVVFGSVSWVLGRVGGAFTAVARIISGGFGRAFRLIPGIAGRVFSALGSFPARVIGLFTRAVEGAFRAVERLGGRAARVGGSIIRGLVSGIKTAIGAGLGFAADIGRSLADWLNRNTPLGDEVRIAGLHFRLPALATGGTMPYTGVALVGERGPEIVHLPGGARVTPMAPPRMPTPSLTGGVQTTAHFYLDRRLIATAVARDTADQAARR